MTGAEIRLIRDRLNLTQVQLAQLLGVHPLTVHKWERDLLVPNAYQQAMLESFGKAGAAREGIGDDVAQALVAAGVIVALLLLLEAALGKTK